MRKFRSGANTISVYNGTSEVVSNTFSGVASAPTVCWYVQNSSNIAFYESAATRGGAGYANYTQTHNEMGHTGIGGTLSGAIVELCAWKQALTPTQISSLFSTYFNLRYPGVFYQS